MVGYLKAIVPAPQKYKETYLKAFTDALNETKQQMLKDYRDTTSTWKHKVKFTASLPRFVNGSYMIAVGTDDLIYGYVDKGTKRHIIRPKRARVLRFRGGYTAKTIPLAIRSRSGGSFGATVFSRGVMHPGTEARKFTEVIAARGQAKFEKALRAKLKP
jgi:hypothetical protein